MITSNLKSIIRRMEQLQAGIPGCYDRALAREYWGPALRGLAERALRAQFAMSSDVQTRARYEALLPKILNTFQAATLPTGATFALFLPFQFLGSVDFTAAAQQAGLAWTPMGRDRKQFQRLGTPEAYLASEQNVAAAKQAVLDWVMLEKELDERDAGKSMEQIAERIQTILGLNPAYGGRTPEMDQAAEGLRGAIEAWLNQDETTPSGGHEVQAPATNPFRQQTVSAERVGFSPEEARQWLEAVLQSWVIFFRVHFRDRLEKEMAKLNRRVQAAQEQLI